MAAAEPAPRRARRLVGGALLAIVVAVAGLPIITATPAAAAPNPVSIENALPGNPQSEWDINGAGDGSIQGYTTDISANVGGTVQFKVDVEQNAEFRIDIYRLGWYGGNGARKVATIPSSQTTSTGQNPCLSDPVSGLVDCGNWSVSATWNVPSTAVSGVFIGRLVREDTGGASHVPFVVRNDTSSSKLLFQTSDTTWHAYNQFGGNSRYTGRGPGTGGAADGRTYKVSYNRPITVRGNAPEDSLFNAEYPMIRWLERNGYDVSYFSGIDTDRRGAELLEHEVFVSTGHDEYWSGPQRTNVEAARDAGVHLAFFSGNEVFWKTRYESSIDGSGTANRTLVSYKETHNYPNHPDPSSEWTGTWRDPRGPGTRPENALTGTIFSVNCCTYNMTVPDQAGLTRLWRTSSVAGAGADTLGSGMLGYEWDEDLDNGSRPANQIRFSRTTQGGVLRTVDSTYGSTFETGSATHSLTMYRAPSGALVFGAGTVQWSWGLDEVHDQTQGPAIPAVQQATVNLFSDMGISPETPQSGIVVTG
ncbi:MAG TPA: N,N-dimethylformamidase beta subunit family domain-containing protein, partial [Acidimicrobiales bacterium]